MKICVLGKKEFVIGFQLCGIKDIFIIDENSFVEKFEECFNMQDAGVLIVEEKYFAGMPQYIKRKVEKALSPVVIPVSEESKSDDIKHLIKRCLGVELWK